MGHHSKYSPSRLSRIVACPGSVSLCAKVEQERQSSYAAEGSLLHLATERCLDTLNQGEKCPSDIVSPHLDKEQCRAVDDCLEYAWNLERQASLIDPRPITTIEQQVTLAAFGQPEIYGTSDYSVEANTILDVTDWKFGKGVEVSAEENDQLYAYALGKIGTPERLKQFTLIRIHVVQPRINNYSIVEVTPQDLQRWLDYVIDPAIDSSQQKNPPFCAGAKQCRWCDGKCTCKHRHHLVNEQASELFKVHARLPNAVDNNEVARLLDNADLIKSYLDDMKAYAMNQIKLGKDFPGYKVVAGRSIRKWANEDATKTHLLMLLDEDDLYTKKFVSPAQAEKLIGRKESTEETFVALFIKPEGKATLALESDRRPALQISAENVFSKMAK